jgi:elongation factor 1-gamma
MDKKAMNEKEFKAKHSTGLFPLLETADGTTLFESGAMAQYFAALAPTSGLMGQTPFEAAKVNDWIAFQQRILFKNARPLFMDTFGYMKISSEEKAACTKAFMEQIDFIEKSLSKGVGFFLVGDNLTVADIIVAAPLTLPYQTWFGEEFWEKCPKTAAWLERVVNLPSFVRRFGYIKKGYDVEDDTPAPAAAKKDAGDDMDMDDLFGDDDAPVEKVVIKKKEKKKAVAMSLVMLS